MEFHEYVSGLSFGEEKGPIINLTQHVATPEQIAQGVVDLPAAERNILQAELTFASFHELNSCGFSRRALNIKSLVKGYRYALIGGAPFFMPYLEYILSQIYPYVIPLYAFSKRVVEEINGIKKSVFIHEGFIKGSIQKIKNFDPVEYSQVESYRDGQDPSGHDN
jgi:hypothetical protein